MNEVLLRGVSAEVIQDSIHQLAGERMIGKNNEGLFRKAIGGGIAAHGLDGCATSRIAAYIQLCDGMEFLDELDTCNAPEAEVGCIEQSRAFPGTEIDKGEPAIVAPLNRQHREALYKPVGRSGSVSHTVDPVRTVHLKLG